MTRLRACWAVHAPGGMHCDAEDADAPCGVLDHGQDVSLGAVQQVGGEEIFCHLPSSGGTETEQGSACPDLPDAHVPVPRHAELASNLQVVN